MQSRRSDVRKNGQSCGLRIRAERRGDSSRVSTSFSWSLPGARVVAGVGLLCLWAASAGCVGGSKAKGGTGGVATGGAFAGSGGVGSGGILSASGGTTGKGGSGAGGGLGAGGALGSGGITASGGGLGSGGISPSGGSLGSGGRGDSGGQGGAGGTAAAGGSLGSGGNTGAGGGQGGAGGTVASGGSLGSGGLSAGGAGGSVGQGGAGGVTGTGGSSSSGGASATGGSGSGGVTGTGGSGGSTSAAEYTACETIGGTISEHIYRIDRTNSICTELAFSQGLADCTLGVMSGGWCLSIAALSADVDNCANGRVHTGTVVVAQSALGSFLVSTGSPTTVTFDLTLQFPASSGLPQSVHAQASACKANCASTDCRQ
jgi:hypothetical protein